MLERQVFNLQCHLLSSNGCWQCCVVLSFRPLLPASATMGTGRKMPFLGNYCCWPSYNPGHSVPPVAQLLPLRLHSIEPQWAPKCISLSSLPLSCLPYSFSLPTFRCSDVWIVQVCLCVKQRILCWVIVVELVNLQGERKSPQFSVMLMSRMDLLEVNIWILHRGALSLLVIYLDKPL